MNARFALCAVLGLLALTARANSPEAVEEELEEITVSTPEARYVAPTTRDRIGRVWIPVHIDGRGPFRLVLDTGAQSSAVVPSVARRLDIPLDRSPPVRMHGVTGSAIAPTIKVGVLQVGDLWLNSQRLAIVEDAFGGAEGLLGVDGLQKRRIYIDFRSDYVNISLSRNRKAARGFTAVPFVRGLHRPLAVQAEVGGVKVRAIIDTGAQATIGNEALRTALRLRTDRRGSMPDELIRGATGEVRTGQGRRVPSIVLGGLTVQDAHVTFSDLPIFHIWELVDEPTLLIGMDILGVVDTLIVDYLRREVHIKPRRG